MLKKILVVFVILVLIIVGLGCYAYSNRGKIIEKMVDYTVQNLTGTSQSKSQDGASQSWIGSLMSSGSDDVKSAFIEAIANRNKDNNKIKGTTKQSLATMAEMFMNATSGEGDADVNQMAQMLVSSLKNKTPDIISQDQDIKDINARDSKGRTLLMNVCRVDVTAAVVKLLIKYGADINAVDENGRTALMYAGALNQNIEVVKLLLENGIDANIKDDQNKTAYDYASDPIIKGILRSHMD